MRLGARKRVRAPLWWRSKNKSVSGPLVVLLLVLLLTGSLLYGMGALRPVMATLAESQAQHLATLAVNDAVVETLANRNITYNDLVTLHTGEDGMVNAIQSNVVEINQLKSEIAIQVQQCITGLDTTQIAVPLGSLFGNELFAGVGPKIPVKLVPVGALTVELHNAFAAAGINQTRHSISMEIKVNMGLLMPTVRQNVTINTQVPIAETVIVGNVPNSYVNIGEADPVTENRVLQLAPEINGQ